MLRFSRCPRRAGSVALAVFLLLAAALRTDTAGAQPAPAVAAPEVLVVRVLDARTGAAVAGALVSASGGVGAQSDREGLARLRVAGPGTRLHVTRIGYLRWEGDARIDRGLVEICLEPAPVRLQAIEVRSRAFGVGEATQAATVVGSAQLAERMAPSVAAIIAPEPGVTARYNGPMATQPVIRGLGGDRVLVLEDGLRTGDIATTAPDHAVTVEPATARRIEVIRGPAGLLYGSNTLGGVVNVVREDVPRELPDTVRWMTSMYGESVNRGVGGAARALVAAGPVAVQIDGSARTASDTRTPGGEPLPFTDLDGFDIGVGAALAGDRGHAGVAVREYRTHYGVPSSFGGVTLPGAHDGGVYIDVRRSAARVDAEWRSGGGSIEAVSVGGNAVRFEQSEFEQGGFVGTRFGQLAASGEAVARLRGGRHRGAVGVSYAWRDLRAEGSFTGTRPATQRTVAAFAVDEIRFGAVTLLAGVRADRIATVPLDSTETLLLRDIRTREFTALTGALGVRAPLGGGWIGSLQLARAFRPPSIEELYSAGPHLASYAYEIGVPDLAAERGLGLDAMLRWQGDAGRIELTGYGMHVQDFIAFAPQIDPATGLPMRDPRLRRYVVYRPTQGDARLWGLEGRATWLPARDWLIDLTGDFPRGSRADGTPLPSMPPPTTRLELRRTTARWSVGATLDGRWAQGRVPPPPPGDASCAVVVQDGEATALPAEFCPTAGVALLGAVASLRIPAFGAANLPATVTLSADNLLDTRWRDPLWRAGLVAPQPGRNLRLAVQVSP
jgi:iron complex outermembrane recepter protein